MVPGDTASELTSRARGPAAALERYRPLVGDWDAFLAALASPVPPCISINRLRLAPERLHALLHADGVAAEAVGWTRGAFRLAADARPGLWWPAQAGLYQVQEEASLLPVYLLDPQPGDRVLDLCAAPGGKAALIAMALGNRGTVVANDKDSRRLAAVRDKMKRLGLLNLTSTVHDGGDFPLSAGPFDCVLVDAPCSAEGTNFSGGAAYLRSAPRFRRWIAGQQRALLRRAVVLTRPGGRIVYSTCSFAPEENEAVVSDILAESGPALRVLPPPASGPPAGAGLEAWEGARFHPDLRHARRLWPHVSATSGFFAVALERCETGDVVGASGRGATALPGTPVDVTESCSILLRHFGLPAETFTSLTFRAKGDHILALAADHAPPTHPRPVSSGVPFIRDGGRFPKPTTSAALLFGDAATRNVVDLDRAQVDAYQARHPLSPRPDQISACDGRGYVLLRHAGATLGLGFLEPGPPARIDSQFPRAWVPHGPRD